MAGCAEAPTPVVAARAEPTEAPDVPTYCAAKTKPCVPPEDFVERLCANRYVSVAPYLFEKHTPFVRLHAKSKTIELKNSLRGPVGAEPIAFAEEVLLLRVVSAPPSSPKKPAEEIYDVLRWDGTCASVPKRDLAPYLTGVPQAARVEFAKLETNMRAALTRDVKLSKLSSARTDACRSSESSEACTQADKALSDAVVIAIRQGLKLPMPQHRPSADMPSSAAAPPNATATDNGSSSGP